MSLRTLLYFYGWRLRAHPFQELLAGAGIAIGVALLFAVQVANTSITGSVAQLLHAITGRAQLELAARDQQGFDAEFIDAVRRIPGVITAAPTLERRGVVAGLKGDEAIELIGVDPSLGALEGSAARDFGRGRLSIPRDGVLIPDRLAQVTGIQPGERLALQMAGHRYRVRVAAILSSSEIGPLTGSSVVLAPLAFAQRLASMPDRVSRILIHATPSSLPGVRAAARGLAAGRLDVDAADATVRRLDSATVPNDQSTALFSAISAMIGALFAFNAMLLTMPHRRAFIAELRMQGFTPPQVVSVLGFQALALGVLASGAGLVLGDLLSRTVFDAVPTYLSFTFPIGTQRIVPLRAVAMAFGAGVAAALLAASRPLFDVVSRRQTLDRVYEERAELGEGLDATLRRWMLSAAVAIVAATVALVLIDPALTIIGVMALGVAVLCVMPSAFATAMPLIDRLARRTHRNLLLVAVMGARSAMTRSVAVAAIAALAVFGSLAIDGARGDLVRGLGSGFAEQVRTSDLWITTVGKSLMTDGFELGPRRLARLRRAPGVAAVHVYQGGMLDIPDRRIWIIARPPSDGRIVPRTQVVHGDAALAERRMREGGWAAVSRTIADERGLTIGRRFTLPTPGGPARLRLAAVVTNLGWGSGAVLLSTRDYRRIWRTDAASAIGIDLLPGTSLHTARRAVERALGPASAFDVESAARFEGEYNGLLREGLTRLDQISILLIVAATLALAAAMSAAMWQRRERLAAHKVQGFNESQLRRTLLFEAVVVLALGCTLGALGGAAGHLLGNRWLELTTGFPAPYSIQGGQALSTLLAILGGAAAIVAAVGTVVVRVPPGASFGER